MYIHELKDWPHFSWDQERVEPLLIQVRFGQGRLIGGMESLGFHFKEEVILQALTQDVVKSSEIEGEILDRTQVRSSVARHLGIEMAATPHADRHVEGVVEMMLDATQKFDQVLTKERLFNWHSSLFPTGRSGWRKIKVADWRESSVQVVSGTPEKEKVHFEGPVPNRVGREMDLFLHWFNREAKIDQVLKAALAHLWFVTIHPFDDGNGRIARALGDLLLARSEKSSLRFYSLSAQIQEERKGYYQILEKTQKNGLDVTPWIEWFLQCLTRSIEKAISTLESVKLKERIWKSIAGVSLNERQHKLMQRLLDGFEGKLTSSKWAKIAKCSQDSAYRDLLDLVEKGLLVKNSEGGRSTSYCLREDFLQGLLN
jgi:Fic family protein